ncbi:BnaC09g40780D [Brassica napus]|uniref:BnaC09g40780D protein n=1 Tax=Brassica napus TaxID=3708 RepID=A0A078FVF5_BRANA|nr:BnaC09g40780D [Brassica napus]
MSAQILSDLVVCGGCLSRPAAGSFFRGSRRIRPVRAAVSKRTVQSRLAKVHSPLQTVPRAGHQRSAS